MVHRALRDLLEAWRELDSAKAHDMMGTQCYKYYKLRGMEATGRLDCGVRVLAGAPGKEDQ